MSLWVASWFSTVVQSSAARLLTHDLPSCAHVDARMRATYLWTMLSWAILAALHLRVADRRYKDHKRGKTDFSCSCFCKQGCLDENPVSWLRGFVNLAAQGHEYAGGESAGTAQRACNVFV
mmetsp:Transcript_10986/g.29498  ORF Transcript_10986/g.29498 Transcript_10986/m.29498 type:complete len:121 (+) Transcript_10986:1557-1919(+)